MKDKRLEDMKSDYENISVPQELKARVEATIQVAKEELQEEATLKKRGFRIPKFVSRTVGVAVAAMLVITVMANSGESVAYAMGNIPILGTIARIVTFREYSHADNNMEANIKVPSISVEDEEGNPLQEPTAALNKSIEEYTSQIIAAYEQDVKEAGGKGHESVQLDYSVVTDNDTLFTLRFDENIIMASGSEMVKIYNLDKNTGKLLALKDLFQTDSGYIDTIAANVQSQMRAQMKADDSLTYFVDSDVEELDFTTLLENASFYINSSQQLVIVFNEYEVAPGYMGSVEFEIPTEAIKDIVKDGYIS